MSAAAAIAEDDLPEPPAKRVFDSHRRRPDFLTGVVQKRWRLVSLDWPTAMFAVSAARRGRSPNEFFFRLNLDGYPGQAPHGHPWDPETGTVLAVEKRPKGERVGIAFRADWDGMYLPIDRSAVSGHDGWRTWRWNDTKDVSFYLRLLHELLNDDDYTGV
jgi:hypothetical protein